MWPGSTKKWSINTSRCHNISLNFHSELLKLIFHLWTPKNAITLHVTISTYLFVFTFQLSVNTIMIREATSSHLLWDYDPPTSLGFSHFYIGPSLQTESSKCGHRYSAAALFSALLNKFGFLWISGCYSEWAEVCTREFRCAGQTRAD